MWSDPCCELCATWTVGWFHHTEAPWCLHEFVEVHLFSYYSTDAVNNIMPWSASYCAAKTGICFLRSNWSGKFLYRLCKEHCRLKASCWTFLIVLGEFGIWRSWRRDTILDNGLWRNVLPVSTREITFSCTENLIRHWWQYHILVRSPLSDKLPLEFVYLFLLVFSALSRKIEHVGITTTQDHAE